LPWKQNLQQRHQPRTPMGLWYRAGVGKLFCIADRFETEIFSRIGLQKPELFSSEHLSQLWEPWACFTATRRSHLGIVEFSDSHRRTGRHFTGGGGKNLPWN